MCKSEYRPNICSVYSQFTETVGHLDWIVPPQQVVLGWHWLDLVHQDISHPPCAALQSLQHLHDVFSIYVVPYMTTTTNQLHPTYLFRNQHSYNPRALKVLSSLIKTFLEAIKRSSTHCFFFFFVFLAERLHVSFVFCMSDKFVQTSSSFSLRLQDKTFWLCQSHRFCLVSLWTLRTTTTENDQTKINLPQGGA